MAAFWQNDGSMRTPRVRDGPSPIAPGNNAPTHPKALSVSASLAGEEERLDGTYTATGRGDV